MPQATAHTSEVRDDDEDPQIASLTVHEPGGWKMQWRRPREQAIDQVKPIRESFGSCVGIESEGLEQKPWEEENVGI